MTSNKFLPLPGSFVYGDGKLLTSDEYIKLMESKGFHFHIEDDAGPKVNRDGHTS